MPCDPGTASEADASCCPVCLAGRYGDSEAASLCLPCGLGISLIKRGEQAVSCVLKKILPYFGIRNCQECVPGHYAEDKGFARVSSVLLARTFLRPVPATVQIVMLAKLACTAPVHGQLYARECDAGKYSAEAGVSERLECLVGEFFELPRTVDCSTCHQGHYSDFTGATACIDVYKGGAIQTSVHLHRCMYSG